MINKWSKILAYLGAEMALFGTKPSSTPTSPFLQTMLVNLCCKCSSYPWHCLTDWGIELLSVQHMSCNIKPTKISQTISFPMGYQKGISFQCVENSEEAKESQSKMVPMDYKYHLTCDGFCQNLGRARGTNTGEGNTLPTSKDGWKQPT